MVQVAQGFLDQYDKGVEAARQREEDAYIKARRPIVNAYEDKAADLANTRAQQQIDVTKEAQDTASKGRQFAMGSNILGFLADQKTRNPDMLPSEGLRAIPPDMLKVAGLDSPEALQMFAERHNNQSPEQMLEEARWFGGEDPVTNVVAVKNNETGKDEMLFVRQSGRRERDPTISKDQSANSGSNPFQQGAGIPGITFDARAGTYKDASGRPITQDMLDRIVAANAAKAQGAHIGAATGDEAAKDKPMSQQTVRETQMRIASNDERISNVLSALDLAISQTGPLSAGLASHSKGVGGPAANLASTLNTVVSNLGLDELLELKKRGGTLGQVTEAEHKLLQGVVVDLQQTQDPDVLKKKLETAKAKIKASWGRVNKALQDDLAARGGVSAPVEAKPTNRRKYNPATGRLE